MSVGCEVCEREPAVKVVIVKNRDVEGETEKLRACESCLETIPSFLIETIEDLRD